MKLRRFLESAAAMVAAMFGRTQAKEAPQIREVVRVLHVGGRRPLKWPICASMSEACRYVEIDQEIGKIFTDELPSEQEMMDEFQSGLEEARATDRKTTQEAMKFRLKRNRLTRSTPLPLP